MRRKTNLLVAVAVGVLLTGTAAAETSEYLFKAWQGRPSIAVRLFVPDDVGPTTTVVIVVHGWSRDAPRYFNDWQTAAQDKGFVLVVPHFPVKDFPGSREFNLGHVFDEESGAMRPKDQWTFAAIEALFDDVVARIDGRQSHYTLYGHSAGGQFVHRFLYYMPESRAARFIAANAGWYTMPDLAISYPYGLKDAGVSRADLATAFGKDLVLLLGREDTNRDDPTLRKAPQAERQGSNRFVRGLTMHAVARTTAGQLGEELKWRTVIVEDAGHNNGAMTPAAAELID